MLVKTKNAALNIQGVLKAVNAFSKKTRVLTRVRFSFGSGGSSEEDESEQLSKRHSDGIFTDIYSRYRKQMAVKKYLAAVLGRRYRQRVKNKGRRFAYL